MLLDKRENIFKGVFSFIIAAIFVPIFSFTTSILYPYHSFLDSQLFQIIGKYWTQGYLPYTDLWDSKGPLIYFINAIGYSICPSMTGVLIVQIVFLTCTIYISYSFIRNYLSKIQTFLVIFAMLGNLAFMYDGGNMTEEYLLPLLILATMMQYSWTIQESKNNHKPIYSLVYGLVLSFSFLTRLSNAIGIILFFIFIISCLVYYREWNNLFKNIVFFLIGFSILVVPFFIYFIVKGTFSEMFYSTIIFNFKYTYYSYYTLPETTKELFAVIVPFINCILLILLGIKNIIKKSNKEYIVWGIVSFIMMIWFFKINAYKHYYIITLPLFLVFVISIRIKKIIYYVSIFFILCGIYRIYSNTTLFNYKQNYIEDEYGKIVKDIPLKDRNNMVAYNCDPYLYLYYDIKPYYPIFSEFCKQSSQDNNMYNKIIDTYSKGNVKWIIVNNNIENISIKNILYQRYTLISENENIKLYRIKESSLTPASAQ